jgi:hypothetical protein
MQSFYEMGSKQTFDRRLPFIRPPVRDYTATRSMSLLYVLDRDERFAKVHDTLNGLRLNRVPLRRSRQTSPKK